MGFENKENQKSDTTKSDFNLKIIKKQEVKKKDEAPKMVAIALDGYGNRVFVNEKKAKEIKSKMGL